MNGLVAFVVWKSDLRHFIVLFNILAILALAGYLLWAVFTRKRVEKTPANETRFLSDDDLEGRRLERVLGWSLVFVTMFAVVMLVYLVREPSRQDAVRSTYFENGSVERGRGVVRELGERGLQPGALAAVRELPRQRRRRRFDDAGHRPRRARRTAAAGVVHVEGARAQHRAAALHRRRGRADHHLRPAGHADAGVRGRWAAAPRTSRRSRTSSRTSSRSS